MVLRVVIPARASAPPVRRPSTARIARIARVSHSSRGRVGGGGGAEARRATASAMASFAPLINALAVVAFGAALRAGAYVTDADGRALCRVIFATTLPAVMARTFATARMDGTNRAVVVASAAYGAACVASSLLLWRARTWRGARVLGDGDGDGGGGDASRDALLAGAAVGLNLGNFAYPLVDAAFGAAGLTMVVVFDAVNQFYLLVVAHAIYTYASAAAAAAAVTTSSSSSLSLTFRALRASVKTSFAKQARNPCLLACVGTVLYRVFYGSQGFPPALDAFLALLASANKPLALIAIGILFQPRLEREDARDMARALARRYAYSMACASGTLFTLGSSLGSVGCAVVSMAMMSPVPLLTVTYAMEFSLNVPFGATLVNYANIASAALVISLAYASYASPGVMAAKLACASVGFFALEAALSHGVGSTDVGAAGEAESSEPSLTSAAGAIGGGGDACGERYNAWRTHHLQCDVGLAPRRRHGRSLSVRRVSRDVANVHAQKGTRRVFKASSIANVYVLQGVLLH